MSLYGSGVECGLHCLLNLVDLPEAGLPSTRDLADYQGVSSSFVAKIFTKLQRAGLVKATEGVRGGFVLAHEPDKISVLAVIDAIEGNKPLFRCRDIRHNCVLYKESPPEWTTTGVCEIHAVMLRAEQRMRASLAETSVSDIVRKTSKKIPKSFSKQSMAWFEQRQGMRSAAGSNPKQSGDENEQ